MVETIARNLHRYGMEPYLRVALLFRRVPRMILSFLALIRTGAYPVPVNFHLSAERLGELLGYLEPGRLIGESEFIPLLMPHMNVLPPCDSWIVAGSADIPSIPYTELEHTASSVTWPTPVPDDSCYVDTTSGTSGSPKGVLTTHRGIAANARSSTEALRITSSDVQYGLFAPFAHVHEVLSRVLLTGGTMVLNDSLHPRSISRTIRQTGATVLMAVPALYTVILKQALRTVGPRTIRILESGGGITAESLIEEFRSIAGVPITPVWGSTETAGIAIAGTEYVNRSPYHIGPVCDGYDMRLVIDDDAAADSDTEGELLLRSEAIMKGYFRLPQETQGALTSGWYRTGDIFRRNERGHLRFRGRKSEMIKYHGHKIHPLEIEQVLELHPAVRRAAVIGRWTEKGEEIPVAVLTTHADTRPKENELRLFCRNHLAGYKVPRRFIFRESLPVTSSGKIMKARLKQDPDDA